MLAREHHGVIPHLRRNGPDGSKALVVSDAYRKAGYSKPSFSRPSADIICGVQTGSHTMCTFADSTCGRLAIFWRASSAIIGAIPQPGAVNAIFTSTA